MENIQTKAAGTLEIGDGLRLEDGLFYEVIDLGFALGMNGIAVRVEGEDGFIHIPFHAKVQVTDLREAI